MVAVFVGREAKVIVGCVVGVFDGSIVNVFVG